MKKQDLYDSGPGTVVEVTQVPHDTGTLDVLGIVSKLLPAHWVEGGLLYGRPCYELPLGSMMVFIGVQETINTHGTPDKNWTDTSKDSVFLWNGTLVSCDASWRYLTIRGRDEDEGVLPPLDRVMGILELCEKDERNQILSKVKDRYMQS
jgi:hypothetical protein